MLLIDFREKYFIQRIFGDNFENLHETKFSYNNYIINCKIVNLEVGDFIIGEDTSNFEIIIERKNINDLCSSIVDGRFRQQKERLCESIGDCKKDVLYIIENFKKKSNINKSVITGAIQNLIFKHNFKVLRTDDENDTFENIMLLYKKIMTMSKDENNKPVAPIKLISKKQTISDNLFALQLSVIPRVSYKTALIISDKYNSMKNLIDTYNNCEREHDKINLLCDIQINDKRKLGHSLSEIIYKSLMS